MSRATNARRATRPAGAVALKRAREDAGLTQTAAAEALQIDAMTLSRYERGKRQPVSDTLSAMAALYRVPIAQLLGQTVVSRETTEALISPHSPLAEHVLVTVGRIKELAQHTHSLAEQIQHAMDRHRGFTDDLERRAERVDDQSTEGRPHLPRANDDYPGVHIADARERLHMSRTELAKAVDLPESQIRKIEIGIVREIAPDRRRRLAKALGTTEKKLFGASKS